MPRSTRIPIKRGVPVTVNFEGTPVECCLGETIAVALLASGHDEFGTTRDGAPRQPLCNMGTCFDCAVTVDGAPLVRACLTPVADGMDVRPTRGV
ncbi:(2Fe-2S)-binding protein [Salinibacterium sp. TMP30]|uniref:(2Fe-2S)-binding protein n=1 Tax=Salinibacterium sp. TMP30 TaxID=3138237 RepID=UPI003139F91E